MKISAAQVQDFHEHGYVAVPDFVAGAEIAEARAALAHHFPAPEAYFGAPDEHPRFAESQFAGIDVFPWKHLALNRLAVHPDLIDAARHLLGTPDIRLYKGELWAKYAGAIDYGQALHRDFGNHMLVVPDALGRWRQLTTFLLLNDVDETSGGIAFVSRRHSAGVPLSRVVPDEDLARHETVLTGRAGTLLLFTTDVFHRATNLTGARGHRFALLADFKPADMTWGGRHAWPEYGMRAEMADFLSAISSDQRTLLDFPAPGHPYWNAQTIRDTQARYPTMDLSDYRAAASAMGV